MNNDAVFRYSYSAKQNEEVQAIRSKYLPQQESKLDELKRLDQGMAALNENQREIVYHHVVEGKTFDAIAAEKGVSKTAVYTSYMRALKKIRSFFNLDR